ncbi:MAG: hypothetical protein WD895_07215 [Acidimicrobiia bacterium]
MRFTGQVRVPEVDHPGVPATFVVEDDQAEVLLDGESLGRWSLFDVHASRLVSAAFSVSLAGDEITFIADEPVDFAYKGVDHMAESWARYKAMALPRRMVAVGRSRRGTLPSRVTELRDAMLANLENLSMADWAEETEEIEAAPAAITAPLPIPVAPPTEVPAPPVDQLAEPIQAPVEREDIAPPVEEKALPPLRSLPMRPGPGLAARPRTEAPPIPAVDPIDIFRPEPPKVEPRQPEPVEIELVESLETEPMEPFEPEPVEPEPVETLAPVALVEPESEPVPEVPQLVRELLDTSSDDDRDETPKRLVVDLGAYEVAAPPAPEPVITTTQNRAPALATTAPVPDRSGIFGAVRAAFVRNKGSHLHEFVEAPGGIGITRHICSECGYISIGVTDTEAE